MLEIIVQKFGLTSPLPCLTHISILVKDCVSTRSFVLNYPFQACGGYIRHGASNTLYDNVRSNICIGVLTLYSEVDFDTLFRAVNSEFWENSQFNWAKNNCANKAYHLLDCAFDLKNKSITQMVNCYQWFCCIGWVGSLGLLSCCFPAPPVVKTPRDVYFLAQCLAFEYGKPSLKILQALAERAKESKEEESKVVYQDDKNDPVAVVCKTLKLV